MATYLGLDAGGTRTRWALIDAGQQRLRGGEAPAVQASEMGATGASAALRGVLEEILADLGDLPRPAVAVAGVAGAGDPVVRAALAEGCRDLLRLRVIGDPEVAAAATLADGPGVALWAGTGSFAVGRAADGALFRVGGRGPLLDDLGSAYDLVRSAAARAVRAADGRGPSTILGARLAAHFGAVGERRLGAALQRCAPSEIAAAAPLVVAAAAAGDAAALAVLEAGGAALADLARGAARRAGLRPSDVVVALGGGVLQSSASYAELAAAAVRAGGFAGARPAGEDAATGAARLAHAFDHETSPLDGWVRDGAA